MAQPHTLILAGALIVALGLVFSAVFAALRAAAAARRAVELAEAAAQETARQQVARGETLERLQDHVSRGVQILAKGCEINKQKQAEEGAACQLLSQGTIYQRAAYGYRASRTGGDPPRPG
ncbi:hypothetical protein [Delftia acidovorans]